MENYTTPKKNCVQISVFVTPEEKGEIVQRAEQENRSISNYCKNKILEVHDFSSH